MPSKEPSCLQRNLRDFEGIAVSVTNAMATNLWNAVGAVAAPRDRARYGARSLAPVGPLASVSFDPRYIGR